MICENIYVASKREGERGRKREACVHANKQISRKMS